MQEASQALTRYFGPSDQADSVPLEGIRRRAKHQLSEFAQLACAALEKIGIAIPPAISLVACPNCALTLDGEHPQREALVQWLQQDGHIARKFKEVEVLFELIRAAEQPQTSPPPEYCFHVGLTSAGPVAFFQTHACAPQTLVD